MRRVKWWPVEPVGGLLEDAWLELPVIDVATVPRPVVPEEVLIAQKTGGRLHRHVPLKGGVLWGQMDVLGKHDGGNGRPAMQQARQQPPGCCGTGLIRRALRDSLRYNRITSRLTC